MRLPWPFRRRLGRCLSRGTGPTDLTHYLYHAKRSDCINWTEVPR